MACVRFTEAVSVARLCSRAVQLAMAVLGAAEHAAEAWDVVVSMCAASLLRLWHLAPSDGQLRLSHRMPRL